MRDGSSSRLPATSTPARGRPDGPRTWNAGSGGQHRPASDRRLATPDDIAPAVEFLASDGAAFIPGQTLSVSGGLTMA